MPQGLHGSVIPLLAIAWHVTLRHILDDQTTPDERPQNANLVISRLLVFCQVDEDADPNRIPLGPRKDFTAADAAPAAPAAPSGPPFVPSEDFAGARPGYAFGTGKQGTGYYRDDSAAAAAAAGGGGHTEAAPATDAITGSAGMDAGVRSHRLICKSYSCLMSQEHMVVSEEQALAISDLSRYLETVD